MPQITYVFDNDSVFTVTTGDTAQVYDINGTNYLGYAITGISGTFNGETITGLNGTSGQYNPAGTYDGRPSGSFSNTVFVNYTLGPNHSGTGYGISDGAGYGFTAGSNSYTLNYRGIGNNGPGYIYTKN